MVEQLLQAGAELRDKVEELDLAEEKLWVYNPLKYAWNGYKSYIERAGKGHKKVLLLGMNPGPWGMAQCGVPFGEITAVRDWMKLSFSVDKPEREHPARPVTGLDCSRSEVSGRRLWGLAAERYTEPEHFFEEHFVANYCPLSFMEETGRNKTPDKLPSAKTQELYRICDEYLWQNILILEPDWLIGVGRYAWQRLKTLVEERGNSRTPYKLGTILHPSPASPHANRDWSGKVCMQMKDMGIWE